MKMQPYRVFLISLSVLLLLSSIAEGQAAQTPPAAARQRSESHFVDRVSGQTADDVVRYALEHNGEVAAARRLLGEVRGRLTQAGLKPNPVVESSASQAVNGPDSTIMVGFELPLELHGRRDARQVVVQRELEMREAEIKDFERRLAAEVRSKYGEVIAAARNLGLSEDTLRLTGESYTLVQARVDHGKSPPFEGSEVFVELNRADAALIGFENKAEQALLDLKKVMGMAPDTQLLLRGDFLASKPVLSEAEALRHALASRPDLVALQKAEQMALAQAEQARSEGRIDASIFANYSRMNLGYDVRGFNDSGVLVPVTGVFHMATFGVRFTLPFRNKNQGLVEAATASADASRQRREFLERVIRNEVTAAYARHARANSALRIYRDRVLDPAIRNLDVIRQTYTLGYKTALDYLAGQRRFTEIETSYTDALKDYFDSIAEIDRVIGTT